MSETEERDVKDAAENEAEERPPVMETAALQEEEAKHRIRVQNDVLAAQRALMVPRAVTAPVMALCALYLEPSRLEEVEEERAVSGKVCAYVGCGNAVELPEPTQESDLLEAFGAKIQHKKFRIDIKKRRIEERAFGLQGIYCSKACAEKAARYAAALSTDAAVVRRLPGRFRELLPRAMAGEQGRQLWGHDDIDGKLDNGPSTSVLEKESSNDSRDDTPPHRGSGENLCADNVSNAPREGYGEKIACAADAIEDDSVHDGENDSISPLEIDSSRTVDSSAVESVARDLAAAGVKHVQFAALEIQERREVRPPSRHFPAAGKDGASQRLGGDAEDLHREFYLEEVCARYPVQLSEAWATATDRPLEARLLELSLLNAEEERRKTRGSPHSPNIVRDGDDSSEDEGEVPTTVVSEFASLYQMLMDYCSARTRAFVAGRRKALAEDPRQPQLSSTGQRLQQLTTRLQAPARLAMLAGAYRVPPTLLQEPVFLLVTSLEQRGAVPSLTGRQALSLALVLIHLVAEWDDAVRAALDALPQETRALLGRCRLSNGQLDALLRVFR